MNPCVHNFTVSINYQDCRLIVIQTYGLIAAMNTTPPTAALFELVKAQNEAYLTAYRGGYEAGWRAACEQMLKQLEAGAPMKGPTVTPLGEKS